MENKMTEIYLKTQRMICENEELRGRIWSAVMNTRVFPEMFETTRVMGTRLTRISVCRESPLSAARRLASAGLKVALLNTANAVSPGGSVSWGGQGLEETLCRCSNLYPCLTKPEIFEAFYQHNNLEDFYYSDRIIYSQNVTFFKSDSGAVQSGNQWFCADVITCPAPNLNGVPKIDQRHLKKVLEGRIHNILAVAEANGAGCLVFSAFGCGQYMNPPDVVAEAFLSQLTQGEFKSSFWEVCFAVEGRQDYEMFSQVLCPWQQNPLFGRNVSVLGDSLGASWPQAVGYFGGQLLGWDCRDESMVSGPYRDSAGSDLRISSMEKGGRKPDVIFVYSGTWDYLNGVPPEILPGAADLDRNYVNYFAPSYEVMLWKLRKNYPFARIYCGLLCPPSMLQGRRPVICAPFYEDELEPYNDAIRRCALKYGCYVVDLPYYIGSYDSSDGIHASPLGLRQLCQGWIRAVEDLEEDIRGTVKGRQPSSRPGAAYERQPSPWPAAATVALSVSGVTLAGLLGALLILM